MADCADLAAFEFTLGQAAVLLDESLRIIGTLEAACIDTRGDCAPLPRGMLSCGEAMRLIPALVILLMQAHPRLLEPGMLEIAMDIAAMEGASGEPN